MYKTLRLEMAAQKRGVFIPRAIQEGLDTEGGINV